VKPSQRFTKTVIDVSQPLKFVACGKNDWSCVSEYPPKLSNLCVSCPAAATARVKIIVKTNIRLHVSFIVAFPYCRTASVKLWNRHQEFVERAGCQRACNPHAFGKNTMPRSGAASGQRPVFARKLERSEAAGCRMVLAGMTRHASQNNPLRLRKLRYGDLSPIVPS
jgi:hypothetical protein